MGALASVIVSRLVACLVFTINAVPAFPRNYLLQKGTRISPHKISSHLFWPVPPRPRLYARVHHHEMLVVLPLASYYNTSTSTDTKIVSRIRQAVQAPAQGATFIAPRSVLVSTCTYLVRNTILTPDSGRFLVSTPIPIKVSRNNQRDVETFKPGAPSPPPRPTFDDYMKQAKTPEQERKCKEAAESFMHRNPPPARTSTEETVQQTRERLELTKLRLHQFTQLAVNTFGQEDMDDIDHCEPFEGLDFKSSKAYNEPATYPPGRHPRTGGTSYYVNMPDTLGRSTSFPSSSGVTFVPDSFAEHRSATAQANDVGASSFDQDIADQFDHGGGDSPYFDGSGATYIGGSGQAQYPNAGQGHYGYSQGQHQGHYGGSGQAHYPNAGHDHYDGYDRAPYGGSIGHYGGYVEPRYGGYNQIQQSNANQVHNSSDGQGHHEGADRFAPTPFAGGLGYATEADGTLQYSAQGDDHHGLPVSAIPFDPWEESDSAASESEDEHPHKGPTLNKDGAPRKPRQPRGKLLKWTEEDWYKALLGLVWASGENGIQLPFEQAAQVVGPNCTAGAMQQAILKLRARLIAARHQIPGIKMSWTRKDKYAASGSKTDTSQGEEVNRPRKNPTRMGATQARLITLPRAYNDKDREGIRRPYKWKKASRKVKLSAHY